jgi:hypothetical protein
VVLALAGCGGSGGDDLPSAVESFERRLEASRGVLHVVTEEVRVVHEDGLPDLPPLGWSDEVWLDLGGRGWRAQRTTRDGGFEQVADERGVRTLTRGGFAALDSASGEHPDFRMRPWREASVVDPVRLVREGRLHVAAATRLHGRDAYIVVVEPDPSTGTRLYIAADDGDLLRITHRRERAGRVRTLIQDYLVYEVGLRRPRSLGELLARF